MNKKIKERNHTKIINTIIFPIITAVIAGVVVYFLTSYQVNKEKLEPRIIVNLASPALVHNENGHSYLKYSLKNNREITAYDIRKGHRIFNEKGDCLKHYYDTSDKYLLDLAPGEESAIHVDLTLPRLLYH